jgi:hypothetical protein
MFLNLKISIASDESQEHCVLRRTRVVRQLRGFPSGSSNCATSQLHAACPLVEDEGILPKPTDAGSLDVVISYILITMFQNVSLSSSILLKTWDEVVLRFPLPMP